MCLVQGTSAAVNDPLRTLCTLSLPIDLILPTKQVVDSMPAPSAPSAENSPTAAAAMAKAPSVLAARSRSRELAAGAGANGVAADAANRPTSPLGNPAVPRGAAGAGSSPLDNLMDVNDVRSYRMASGS